MGENRRAVERVGALRSPFGLAERVWGMAARDIPVCVDAIRSVAFCIHSERKGGGPLGLEQVAYTSRETPKR